MKKICLVGCGTIARLHAKNLVGKVELSFHSRTRPAQKSSVANAAADRYSHRTPTSSTARWTRC